MRGVGRNFTWLAAATIAGQLIGFVVLAAAARKLGPGLMGSYGFAIAAATYVGAITNLGASFLGSREVSQYLEGTPRVYVEVMTIQAALALASIALMLGGRNILATSNLTASLMLIGILGVAVQAMSSGWLLQAMGHSPLLGLAQLLGQVVYGILAFFLLTSGPEGVTNFAWINVAGAFVTTSLTFLFVWRLKALKMVRLKMKGLQTRLVASLKVGAGLVILRLYFSIGPIAIGLMSTENEVGYYSVAQKIPLAIAGISAAWVTTWLPHASRLASSSTEHLNLSIERIVRPLAAVTIIATAVSAVISQDLMSWLFGPAFEPAADSFAILIAASGLAVVGSTIATAVVALKGDASFSYIVGIAGLVAVVVTLGLVPLLGSVGAAIGMLAAECVTISLMLRKYQARSGSTIRVDIVPLLLIAGLSTVPALLLHLLDNSASLITTLLICTPGWLFASLGILAVSKSGPKGSD